MCIYQHILLNKRAIFHLLKMIVDSHFLREEANARRKTDLLSPPTLKTKGMKFSLDEANER
jgi:hypothetical protein